MSSEGNLAQEKMLLRALKEFVNTGDSSAMWSRLKKHWPDLLPVEVYSLPFDRVHALNEQLGTTNVVDRPDHGLGLLGPGMSYLPREDGTVRFRLEALELRDQLRRVWRDGESANELLPRMFSVRASRDLLPRVLGLTDDAKRTGDWYGYASSSEDHDDLTRLMGSFTLKVDWVRGSL